MPELETLDQRIRLWARRQPDHPAIEMIGGPVLSYRELARAVDRRAGTLGSQVNALEKKPQGAPTRVLMTALRGPEFVVTLLACWRLGLSAVPLDPARPADVEEGLLATLDYALDARSAVDLGPVRKTSSAPLRAGDEAYVLFTSGSSGSPKGVRIGHGGLPHLWRHQAELFRVSMSSRTSWMLAAHFDASISDVGVPLWSGATLVIFPEGRDDRLGYVESRALTHIDLPPAALQGLIDQGLPPALETIVVGGEPAPPAALRAAARAVHVVNVYGPTETTVCASAETLTPDAEDSEAFPSIGRPLPGVDFHVDGDAPSQRGELLISGWGVGLGYVEDRPSPDPFVEIRPEGAKASVRAYRTGDLVERRGDGAWSFLGRIDRQIQLRGRRLELGEIEAALLSAPDVEAAAAVLCERPAPHVVAFIEGRAASAELACASRLEPWKRPERIEVLSLLPRLSNRKVDLRALEVRALELRGFRSIEWPGRDQTGEDSPRDPLALAWRAALGAAAHGTDDEDFFELGGDSITALELVVEAARRGVAVEAEALDRARTLGALRRCVTAGVAAAELDRRAAEAFAQLRLPASTQRPAGEASDRARGVLLTGATGLLGTTLLRDASFVDRDVWAIVRGRGERHARARLESKLGAPLPPSVRVLRGDLGLPLLGLQPDELSELKGRVGGLVHAAGAVDLVRSYESLEDVHVRGTGRVMQLAAQLGARLHHVSTLSVFVETDLPPGAIREVVLDAPALRVFGGYAQSKWVADALARRYPWGGSVLRPGLLTAPSSGARRGAPLDQLSRVIRGVEALGAWPGAADSRRFDVTPPECAATLVTHLLDVETVLPTEPIHLANATSATGAQLYEAMRLEGVHLKRVKSWPPPMESGSAGGAADRAVALAALNSGNSGAARSGDLFLASDYTFECARVAELCPSAVPQPPTLEFLRLLVRIARTGHQVPAR